MIKDICEIDMFQTMIFVNKKQDAFDIQHFLNKKCKGIQVEKLIGDMDIQVRDKIIDDFRNEVIKCLITTNVLARGIDVPEVDFVINYDVPYIVGSKLPDCANFLHRVGRAGRFGTEGVALTLVTDKTYDNLLDQIEDFYHIEIKKIDSILELKAILELMRKN